MKKGGSVYILTNISNDVLYIGVTSDLFFRLQDHKSKNILLLTSKYNCTKLVYYENFSTMDEAISREKQLKIGTDYRRRI
jgi:putative endonuclease